MADSSVVLEGEPATSTGSHYGPALVVAAVGLLLLVIPAWDSWLGIRTDGWTLTASFAENILSVSIPLGIVAGAIWLARVDWPTTDARLVAKWVGLGVGGLAVIYGTIFVAEILLFNVTKLSRISDIIDGNGIITGAGAAFAMGVYDVKRRQHRREMRHERDRFTSLFEETDVALAVLDCADGLSVTRCNPSFRSLFDEGVDRLLDAAEPTDESSYTTAACRAALVAGEEYDAEIHVPCDALQIPTDTTTEEALSDGRFYMLRVIPVGRTETFLMLTDITPQKRHTRLLESRSEQLEREKSRRERELEERSSQLQFLHSMLRHDIQNSMFAIDTRAEVLRDELDGQQQEYAETIHSRAREVGDQIDRVQTALDRLTHEDATNRPVALSQTLADCADALATDYPTADVTTDIEDGLTVTADALVSDVVMNLLRNAVEHNDKETPTVELAAHSEDGEAVITIADNGPGIPPNRREEMLRRGISTVDGPGPAGSGFGLFFANTMVSSYGGHIDIEDNEPVGTRITVTIPLADD